MKKNHYILASLCLMTLLLAATACRNDDYVVLSDTQALPPSTIPAGQLKGMYVLCEGNMGSNKASVDYLYFGDSLQPAAYHRNIYAERNPSEVKELGDVGNDIQIYGNRLWMTINCSNKVEVATADGCLKIGKVDVPNCRYLAFSGGYAYVSSYVGPVQMSGDAPLGRVYKVDTLTLQKVDSVVVGYQPEEMAVVDGRLYVANSGGYRAPNYDRTVSVIDLDSFREVEKIDVAPNLHRLRADRYGQLWVSSRGDYASVPSRLYLIAADGAGRRLQPQMFDPPVSDLCIVGDSLYFIGNSSSNTQSHQLQSGIINVNTRQQVASAITHAPELEDIELPYGIVVNPETRDFYLMDAKNYVSSGQLFHFLADGSFDWKVWTGDIPTAAAFVGSRLDVAYQPIEEGGSRYIQAVDEYVPAPGQFVNTMPAYEEGDDARTMAAKCTEALAGGKGGTVCLGGYGGYITFHFDHRIKNVEGECDFYIAGNAHSGASEAGIVMVSIDENRNGIPDDTWFELKGSADDEQPEAMTYHYTVTYQPAPMADIPWTDSKGNTGFIYRNGFHQQEYYPQWIQGELSFTGTLLPPNAVNQGTEKVPYWVLGSFGYGYVDNAENRNREACSFDIGWAVDENRQPVKLPGADFIRVYTALNQQCGWIGETSTEITGAEDLHFQE